MPLTERVITIEDTAELVLNHPHVVRLESRPGGFEGTGVVSIRDLLRNSLRMRPDRIIVGEVRGGEVLEMLQAMSTGHDGSMGTIHASSPRECLYRLEMLAGFAGFQGSEVSLRRQIANAIDFIVQIGRLSNGKRRILSITEVTGPRQHHLDAGAVPPRGHARAGRHRERALVSLGILPHSPAARMRPANFLMDDRFDVQPGPVHRRAGPCCCWPGPAAAGRQPYARGTNRPAPTCRRRPSRCARATRAWWNSTCRPATAS